MANVIPLLRRGLRARLPDRLDELRGPMVGTVVLPMHLTWHSLREFDVTSEPDRLRLYTIVLSQGKRNDIARFVHPDLLRQDWPQLRDLITPQVRDACVRKLGLAVPT